MAKLSKRIRKRAKRVSGSQFLRDVLRDLIKAAATAAAAKLVESRTADKVKRKAKAKVRKKKERAMSEDKWRDDSGTDYPQTINAEPLEETRSGRLLDEQQSGAGAQDVEDESGADQDILGEDDDETAGGAA